ncbi:hypothetical protein C6497_07470, partial [Candidatus Poribacteria bacterium]
IKTHAKDNLFLLTPITNAQNAKKLAYLDAIETSPQLQAYQQNRKVVIEPIFSLLCDLTGTHNNQKQLPVSRIENVRTFILLSVMLLQIAMLVNSIWNLPSKQVSRMKSLFQ